MSVSFVNMYVLLGVLCFVGAAVALEKGFFMGCYMDLSGARFNTIEGYRSPKQCVDVCHTKYYRYSLVRDQGNCICSNYLGDQKNSSFCKDYCDGCEVQHEIADVYYAGILVNGPPRNLLVQNITDTYAHVAWEEPESFLEIPYYKVQANVLKTYSSSKLVNLEWQHSNNTFRTSMLNLHPGTHYNVTIQAGDDGAAAYSNFTTKIGDPDQKPAEPEILDQKGETMRVKLKPVSNNNGPVTSYLIVVINADSVQAVQIENLKPYRQAASEGYSYYIAAEVQPERINNIFIVGDKMMYGKYYNAPLDKDSTYHVMLGVVSRTRDAEKVAYSHTSAMHNDVVVLQMNKVTPEESSVLVIILSVAIVFISLLIIAGLIGFYFLRNRVHHRHRQRLNDNQELTLQGPMIDVENNGYIPEDEPGNSNHYENLNEQVWIIPRNLLNIEHTILLGIGKFGRVHSGSVLRDNVLVPSSVYSIADRKLDHSDKKAMLKDLDVLIKSKRAQTVIDLIGTCESMDTVCVVLEHASSNLKEILLNSRVLTGSYFTNLSESQVFDFAIDVAKGMEHLHARRILHKELCSVHVAIVNGCAKITGFGLAKYYKTGCSPEVTRFTAMEVLRGHQHITKSDVWSYACVLWEICALGGTPYGSITNGDLPEKVIRGLHLVHLPYVSDSLYQIMLNCWQIDFDERPSFGDLIEALYYIKNEQCLDFSVRQGFQYEQYYPELELARSANF